MYDDNPRVGLDCQQRSRSDLCSKLPDMRSVGDFALNSRFANVNVNKLKQCCGIVKVDPFYIHFHCIDNKLCSSA